MTVAYFGSSPVSRIYYGDQLVFPVGVSMEAAGGVYTLAGQPVDFARTRRVVAALGAYTLAGQAATLRRSRIMPAAVGSYALAGQAATLRYGKAVYGAVGAYALTGQAVGSLYQRIMPAAVGAYALAGQAATLTRGIRMVASAGSYALAGQDAGYVYNRNIKADAGTYLLQGQTANLLWAHLLLAAVGSYALTGQNAQFSKSIRMSGDVGTYVQTGQSVGLLWSRRGAADLGSYTLAGQAAVLLYGRSLAAAAGSYALAGQDATLTVTGTAITVSIFSSTTSTAATIAWPASIAAGDVAVLLDLGSAFGAPANVVPTGFTGIGTGTTTNVRASAAYKILTGSETGNITGMSATVNAKTLLIFRGSSAIASVTVGSLNAGSSTGASPTPNKTITANGQTTPLVTFGGICNQANAATIASSPDAFIGQAPDTKRKTGYTIFNPTDTPANETISFTGNGNCGYIVFYLQFA